MCRIFLIVALIAQGVPAIIFAQSTPPASPGIPAIPSGREIIARMYHRYAGHWYCKADIPLGASLFDPAKPMRSH